MASKPSQKRLLIEKASKSTVIVTSVTLFITIFCLFSVKNLLGDMAFQNRVETAKQKALTQLQADVVANNNLVNSYESFNGTSANVLGGASTGTGANQGDNAKIILDALPSQYDFPALATSLNYLLNSQGVSVGALGGTDAGSGTNSGPVSGTSSPVLIPISFGVSGPYQNIQNLISALQHSIRPFSIQTLTLSGDQSNLSLSVTANTYYQPGVGFQIGSETVN
jgi:hypothetical protein